MSDRSGRRPASRRPGVAGGAPVAPDPTGVLAPLADPAPGVDYTGVLSDRATGGSMAAVRSLLGFLAGVSLYLLLVPLASELVAWIGWQAAGRPGAFQSWLTGSLRFEHLDGLLGTNLALALLTPIVLVIERRLHGRRPRWMCSVQPGMRWRYLLFCLVVGAVVLGVVQLGLLTATPGRPVPRVWLWLLVILLTSPLQAAGEEFFFRGYLMQAIGGALDGVSVPVRRAVAAVGSALVFALFHGVQNPALFVDRFGFGLLAGALVVATGGLEAGIACHVANNLLAFGWSALHGGVAQARAVQSIGWAQAGVDVAAFAVFAVLALLVARPLRLATRTPGTIAGGAPTELAPSRKSR